MSNLTWKLNSLFWVILSQNLCKFCYSFWPILCPAKAAFDKNKTTAKNSWKFVITWPVSLLSLILTNLSWSTFLSFHLVIYNLGNIYDKSNFCLGLQAKSKMYEWMSYLNSDPVNGFVLHLSQYIYFRTVSS